MARACVAGAVGWVSFGIVIARETAASSRFARPSSRFPAAADIAAGRGAMAIGYHSLARGRYSHGFEAVMMSHRY